MPLPPTRPQPGPSRAPGLPPRRGPAIGMGLGLVALAAATIAGLAAVFLRTWRGQAFEARVMYGMATNPRTDGVLLSGLELVSVSAIVVALLVLGGLGLLRRRPDLAVAAAVLVAGANVTTQVLKYGVLERADLGLSGYNTLPSGHVTVITSLLVASLLVLSPAWRPMLVPVVGFLATCAGVGTIILNWHRPSDVVAAYAVVLGWTGLVTAGMAALGRVRGRVPGGPARAAGYALAAAVAAGVVGLLILAAGVAASNGRRELLLSAGALAAVALVCAGVVGLSSYAVDLLGEGEPVDH